MVMLHGSHWVASRHHLPQTAYTSLATALVVMASVISVESAIACFGPVMVNPM